MTTQVPHLDYTITPFGVAAQGGVLTRPETPGADRPFAALGAQWRAAREAASLSRDEAAARGGVGLTTLQRYEEGERQARAGAVETFARLYNVPTSRLLPERGGELDAYSRGLLRAAAMMSDTVASIIRDATPQQPRKQPRAESTSRVSLKDEEARRDQKRAAAADKAKKKGNGRR